MELNTDVRNKDLINEIKEGYIRLSEGLFEKSKDDYVNYFLDEIKVLILEIDKRGNNMEREEVKTILANKIEFNDSLTETLKIIINLYSSLYKILLEIEERENNLEELDDYTISIGNIKSGR